MTFLKTAVKILDLNALIKNCTDCGLHKTRHNAVPGTGPTDAEIMFIGEGPGYHEDKEGNPFVGPSGDFLMELLLGIGLSRDDVFLANMLKCRAPNNRDPMSHEISSCSKYLDKQIELIDPKLIVTLGKFSTAKFIQFKRISDVRGKLFIRSPRLIFPIIHPAAALHNPDLKDIIVKDFKSIPYILSGNYVTEPIKEEYKQLNLL